jgi:hypothetical protein
MDWVVPAEIFSPCQNSLAERGKLQLAALVSFVTITVVVHLQRERPLVEAGHHGCRTMSPPVQKGSDLPVPEDTPLAARHVAGKDVKWTCVACRYQLQHPHLRRAKARRLDRKLFEQLQDGLLKLRQDAEILAEEVDQ